jgi:hypothetical protein
MKRAVVVAGLLLLAACASASVSYRPRSAVPSPQVTDKALMAYEDDVKTLVEAGGTVLGELRGGGNGYADNEDVQQKACEEAARRGGTHVLIVTEGYVQRVTTLPGSANIDTTVNRQGTQATTNVTYRPPQDFVIDLPVGSYLVVRVPQEQWESLPEGLKPASAAPGFKGNWWEAPRTPQASR